jgi:hypothetical protein
MENPPATTPEWIAHHAVICRSADGTEHPVVISIGRPYDTGHGDWACPVETAGLHGRHPDMMGVDSLQALCLALSFARKMLEGFVEKGGSLIDPDSREEWSLQDLRAVFGADTHLGRPRP